MVEPGDERDTLADALHAAFRDKAVSEKPEEARKRASVGAERKVAALAAELKAEVSERESPPTLVDDIAPLRTTNDDDPARPTLIDPIAPAPASTDAPPLRQSSGRQRVEPPRKP